MCAEARLVSDEETSEIQSPLILGRSRSCDITVDDDRISRQHTLIQRDSSGNWWILDQGSTNGTFLNFKQISQAVILKDGDRIQVGGKEYFFYSDASRSALPVSEKKSLKGEPATVLSTTPCWLIYCHVIGTTKLSKEVDPHELSRSIGDWGHVCEQILKEYDGEINRFLGDGFLAFWSAPATDISLLVKMLSDLQSEELSQLLDLRFVLHHGDVPVGGLMSPGEKRLSGKAVDYVMRTTALASERGERVFITNDAAKLMLGVSLKNLGELEVPGFVEAKSFYSFEGL